MIKLAITANGNSDPIKWYGGKGTFLAGGTFDGATIKLQARIGEGDDASDYADVGDAVTFDAAGMANFELSECDLRVVTSGGGGSLDAHGAIGRPIPTVKRHPTPR